MEFREEWGRRSLSVHPAEAWPLLFWPFLASSAVFAIAIGIFIARKKLVHAIDLAGASGALVGAAMFLFAADFVPLITRRDDVRPLAARIDAAVPPNTRLVLFDPGWEPALFYLRTPFQYATNLAEIPPDAACVLVRVDSAKARAKRLNEFARKRPEWELTGTIRGERNVEFLLLQRRDRIPNHLAPPSKNTTAKHTSRDSVFTTGSTACEIFHKVACFRFPAPRFSS